MTSHINILLSEQEPNPGHAATEINWHMCVMKSTNLRAWDYRSCADDGCQSASLGDRVDRTILKMEAANIVETSVPTYKKEGIIIQDAIQKKSKRVKSTHLYLQWWRCVTENKQMEFWVYRQTKMRRAIYVWRNIEGLSHNSCYWEKEVLHILSVSVALRIQHAMRM